MKRRKFIENTILSTIGIGIGCTLVSCSDEQEYINNGSINQIDRILMENISGKNKIYIINYDISKSISKVYYKQNQSSERLLVSGYIMDRFYISDNMKNNRNLVIKPYTTKYSKVEYNTPIEVRLFNKIEFKCISNNDFKNRNIRIQKYFI